MLKTKSIQQPRKNTDGIRVCIMRRIKPEFDFDMWIIPLAPSTELLKKYHGNEIGWKQYEELYSKEVLSAS